MFFLNNVTGGKGAGRSEMNRIEIKIGKNHIVNFFLTFLLGLCWNVYFSPVFPPHRTTRLVLTAYRYKKS